MRKNLLSALVVLAVVALIVPNSAYSAGKGTLRVIVVDAESGILPGVTVTITSRDMMKSRSLIADENAEAWFVNLVPSFYEVKAVLKGFNDLTLTNVVVNADKETTLRVTMHSAAVSESITVVAPAPAVDTKHTMVAEYVEANLVTQLPVARDFVGYIQLMSGSNMIPNSGGRDTGNDPTSKGGINYNSRNAALGSTDNFYYLEGVNITGMSNQKAGMTFNDEVIQEEQVITSGAQAEYGGGKGVITNIVTKSGGNRLSGSINYYLQSKSFWGKFRGLAAEDSRLRPYIDNKFDTAATLGGPILKDKLWFFASGQYRNNSNEFQLSESASSTQELTDYMEKRYNGFGKLSFQPTNIDSLSLIFFIDQYDIVGSRNINNPINRQSIANNHYMSYSANYQHIFGTKSILSASYGHYEIANRSEPRYPDSGAYDQLYFVPGSNPRTQDYMFGTPPTISNNKSWRDQYIASYEHYLSNMRIKAGVAFIRESDRVASQIIGGQQLQSLAPGLAGWTLLDVINAGIWPFSEFRNRLLPQLNANWDSTAAYYDTDGDGVLTEAELGAATFTTPSEHGIYFLRWFEDHKGANTVRANRWTGYVMDDWRISKQWSLNAGIRIEDHRYIDSNGDNILHMKPVFLPRVGLSWDIGGRGIQKLSLFYGHYTDPMDFRRIHNAGDLSGQVRLSQMYLANNWYTTKVVGSATKRDYFFAANAKDQVSRELSLSYMRGFGNQFILTTQVYYRADRNIVDDLDLNLYVVYLAGDPLWGSLALTWQDFGYPASGPPAGANYFIGNLFGAKRNIYGFDFELEKRFSNRSLFVAQYSFKRAMGNSVTDKEALFQGDMPEIDPRNPWMWGQLPGTIPHMFKLFGTYETPIGLNVGAVFYWQSGTVFTQSFLQYDDYLNAPLNDQWTELAKTGQERGPAWYNIDFKLSYPFKLRQTSLELFFDVYNLTDNQNGYWVEAATNNQQWAYKAIKAVLNPRRIYLGARFRF